MMCLGQLNCLGVMLCVIYLVERKSKLIELILITGVVSILAHLVNGLLMLVSFPELK